jgi:hypothetical protein
MIPSEQIIIMGAISVSITQNIPNDAFIEKQTTRFKLGTQSKPKPSHVGPC